MQSRVPPALPPPSAQTYFPVLSAPFRISYYLGVLTSCQGYCYLILLRLLSLFLLYHYYNLSSNTITARYWLSCTPQSWRDSSLSAQIHLVSLVCDAAVPSANTLIACEPPRADITSCHFFTSLIDFWFSPSGHPWLLIRKPRLILSWLFYFLHPVSEGGLRFAMVGYFLM